MGQGDLIGQSTSRESFKPLFELLSEERTGLDFTNALTPDLSTRANLFDFDYFYNGGGVALLDFDNDGLQDLFFCGNQVGDRLYKNRGDFHFTNASEDVNMIDIPGWSNGVCIVDINADGWEDIYVSRGGPQSGLSRRNLLWINHQGVYFSEEADRYGLGDRGLSTQSVFFDYDRDGDLDCLVMNENDYYGLGPLPFYNAVGRDSSVFYASSSHLYRNDDGVFVDVTEEAGLLRPSFGLGVEVADLNADGWLDLYMSNDYFIPEALYINQGNGTFREEGKSRCQQMPFYGMGIDIADLDNDGDQDIFVLDMAYSDHYRSKKLMRSMNVDNFRLLVNTLQFPYQYMYNALQLNNGVGRFDNIAHYGGVAKTGWSWTALLEDMDNDGLRDIFVTTGYRKYGMDNDFQRRVKAVQEKYNGAVPLLVKKNLYDSMWSELWPNVAFRNTGNMQFVKVGAEWGLNTPSYSNGAAIGDLNNDGHLDIVVNNIDSAAFVYKGGAGDHHWVNVRFRPGDRDRFPLVRAYASGDQKIAEVRRVRGYFSSSQPMAHFGLGAQTSVDSIIVEWKDGTRESICDIRVDQTITWDQGGATAIARPDVPKRDTTKEYLHEIDPVQLGLDYRHKENKYDDFEQEVLLPYKQSALGPPVVSGDLNGDGRTDVIIGGSSGQPTSVFINGSRGFTAFVPQAFSMDAWHEDGGFVLFDADGDGDRDLYTISAGNAGDRGDSMYIDRLYINPGNGNFRRAEDFVDTLPAFSGGAVVAMDVDRDGRQDLVVGNRIVPHEYPLSAPSYIYLQTEAGWEDRTEIAAPELSHVGIVNDMVVTDFNRDGIEDLIVVGEWAPPHFFQGGANGLVEVTRTLGLGDLTGWWWSVTPWDFNADGWPDYVLGNAGLNMKYKADASDPLEVFAGDMDDNNTWDLVLAHPEGRRIVPVRGRECSAQQMPFIKEKFKSYDAFASASLKDIYGMKLKEAYSKRAVEFRSLLLINKGGEGFEVLPLPWEAQLFPIMDAAVSDFDGDGREEVFLMGNEYNTEVETPRWDAGHGLLLRRNEAGTLSTTKDRKEWYARGNFKHVQVLKIDSKTNLLILTENNGRLKCFVFPQK